MVTHGWMRSGYANSTQLIKDVFLKTTDVNVVIVDWERDAAYMDYFTSAYLTIIVAKKICEMVLTLSRKYNLNGENMHLIGHSLGAHVVGLAGIKLRHQNFLVDRVTGLYPARPLFEFLPMFAHITKKSAQFVDIIHTNIGILGYQSRIGHEDFYPNGGIFQPHCCDWQKFLNCEHQCSYIYFQEAIRGKRYVFTRCDSYFNQLLGLCDNNDKQILGLPSKSARGTYFLAIPD